MELVTIRHLRSGGLRHVLREHGNTITVADGEEVVGTVPLQPPDRTPVADVDGILDTFSKVFARLETALRASGASHEVWPYIAQQALEAALRIHGVRMPLINATIETDD